MCEYPTYENQYGEQAANASTQNTRAEAVKPHTRMNVLVESVMEATQRLRSINGRVERVNAELTGSSGPPSELSASIAVPKSSGNGTVSELEEAVSALHRTITDLDNLTSHLGQCGLVA